MFAAGADATRDASGGWTAAPGTRWGNVCPRHPHGAGTTERVRKSNRASPISMAQQDAGRRGKRRADGAQSKQEAETSMK